jgi:hypothetical protein
LSLRRAHSLPEFWPINGVIVDSNGAVVRKARVELRNPVGGFGRLITTDSSGRFEFTNIPFNPDHLIVMAAGFAFYAQDVEPRSSVPVSIAMKLQVASSTTEVTVELLGGDLVENNPTLYTGVDKNLFDKLPLESKSSSVSSLVNSNAVDSGNLCGLQWTVPRTGRPRGEFFFGGWPADHGSAEQGVLQPDSPGRDPRRGRLFFRFGTLHSANE